MLHSMLIRLSSEITQSQPMDRELHQPLPLVDRYEEEVSQAVDRGAVTTGDIEMELGGYQLVPNDTFTYADAASDLLRRAANRTGSMGLARDATEHHCWLLVSTADRLFDEARGNPKHPYATTSLHLAIRAEGVLGGSTHLSIDPELTLRVHLAKGRVYAYPGSISLYLAFSDYLKAANLMKEQGWLDRYQLLMAKLVDMARYVARGTTARTEPSLLSIDRAAEVAEEAGDVGLLETVTLARVRGYRMANLFDNAEGFARQGLALPGVGDSFRRDLLFELASALGAKHGLNDEGTQDRAELAEATAILEELAASDWAPDDAEGRNLTLMNLATLYASQGYYGRAAIQYEALWGALSESGDLVNKVLLLLQWGRCLYESGKTDEAREKASAAHGMIEEIKPPSFGALFNLHAGSAYLWHELGDLESACSHASAARDLYTQELDRLVDPSLWKGIYSNFHRLDSYVVEAHLKRGTGETALAGLFHAEQSKSRTFTRLRALVNRHQLVVDQAERAQLIEQRIERLLRWTEQKPGRTVLSLFVGNRGLGIVAIRDGEVSQRWLEDFDEMAFLRQIVFPLAALLSRGYTGDSDAFSAASTVVEAALAQTGEALWRCLPLVAEGGSDLLILPHRMLRAFPAVHARLPGGRRLSELFETITVVPSLDLPAVARRDRATRRTAVADTGGDLLFARFEALRGCRRDECLVGEEGTSEAIKGALNNGGTVLLACHGSFQRKNPWDSVIHASDQDVSLFDLCTQQKGVQADLIYLSACEAGRTDINIADDPVGFPALFSYTGARAVVGPLWQVDDFTALLFSDAFFEEISRGTPPSRSTMVASRHVRQLSAEGALEVLGKFRTELSEMLEEGRINSADAGAIEGRFAEIESWLQSLHRLLRPFARILDWGGFQCHSNPFTEEEDVHVQ